MGEAGADSVMLLAYDLTVCLIAVGLFADLLWRRWAQAAVTGLVVDLGESAAGGVLRDRLAQCGLVLEAVHGVGYSSLSELAGAPQTAWVVRKAY